MKKIAVLIFLFSAFQSVVSVNYTDFRISVYSKINYTVNPKVTFLSGDETGDEIKIKKENPILDDIDLGWYREKYRIEKIFLATGIVSMAIGIPLAITGLVNYTLPLVDKSSIGDDTYIIIMGVGGGLITIGATFTIVGGVRYGYLKKKDAKSKMSIQFKNFGYYYE